MSSLSTKGVETLFLSKCVCGCLNHLLSQATNVAEQQLMASWGAVAPDALAVVIAFEDTLSQVSSRIDKWRALFSAVWYHLD